VELLDGALGDAAIVVVDEGEAAWTAGFAVRGYDDLQRIADRPEVLPDVDFGRAVRQIPDE
jgi:hypothetical protein